MKKTLFLLCLIGCWLTTRSVSAQFYGEVPLYFSEQYGTLTVSWEHISEVEYYSIKASGDVRGDWSYIRPAAGSVAGTQEVWTLPVTLNSGAKVTIEVSAGNSIVGRGTYIMGTGMLPTACSKSMGTMSASFRYYYDSQQHRWAAIVYVNHVPADGPDNTKHQSFWIHVKKGTNVITYSYCMYGSGYVYVTDPRGDYHVKVEPVEACSDGVKAHYMEGYFQIIRESPDEAGITLMEYYQ